jgi:RimJ/RimL family protein N-acetyltransferase
MIKIAKNTAKDATELHNLYLTSFWEADNILEDPNDNYSILDEKYTIKHIDVYLKAKDGSQIIGFLKITRGKFTKNNHSANLEIYILPEFRKMGVATKLLKAGLKKAKILKIKRIELEVWSNNTPAIRLYKKLGFKTEGKKNNAYRVKNKYVDSILMYKWLK